ncbi:cardiolipin synthase [Desulfatiglans anilini]|uniref:cardiolipin synthase n=1 Tax=Desulfatiglans anilini TaxID=90728 RepID=UPI001ABFDB13|nr:cardiolipin synthase [Desulfatiglans anilini]
MNPHMVSTVVLVVHWVVIVILSIRVVMRRPPVGVAMAWLVVVFSVPFAGAAVYLLFGEKRLGRSRAVRIQSGVPRLTRWQASLGAQAVTVPLPIGPPGEPLRRHAERLQGFPALPGNETLLLSDFESVFDHMIRDIGAAEQTVHLCFYIWEEKGRTGEIVDALTRAAQRGVQCRAIADALGSKTFLKGLQAGRLRRAGVDLRAAWPTGLARALATRTDLRNHRKIAVIDGRVAYTGSQNLVDPRFFKQKAGVGEWVDAMVRIKGPAAASLDGVFLFDWSVETGATFEPPTVWTASGSAMPGGSVVQVVPSGPDLQAESIHQVLLKAIYGAECELVMTTPYFVPDDALLTALTTAALCGVAVTLIIPARNDSLLVRHASAAHFDDLMSAGVRIALFNGGLLHTKSLTIDGAVSVFGSVNLDMRSFWLDSEISLLVYDRDFTGRLRDLQERYLRDSERLDPDVWNSRPSRRRFVDNACRLLGPLL